VEGLGIVYLEASACGVPVIAGNSGGAPDAVREGVTGYVVNGEDRGALVERAVALLSDPAKARRMGSAGRAFVEEKWRWSQIAEKFQAMLQV